MRTTIVILTLLTLVVAATVASADRGYTAYVQKVWRQQQAEQQKADQQFDSTFRDVAKSLSPAGMPDLGTGWGTAATGGGQTDSTGK